MGKSNTYHRNAFFIREGSVELFQRGSSDRWYAMVKTKERKQCPLVQSLRTKNREEAIERAAELYDDVRYKERQNLPVGSPTIRNLYRKWFEAKVQHMKDARKKSITKAFERFYLPRIGTMRVTDFTPQEVTKYWDWRRAYWVSGPGKDATNGFAGTTPGRSTLATERTALVQMFNWAHRQSVIMASPVVELPETASTDKETVRPAFTWNQYCRMMKFLKHQYLPPDDPEKLKEYRRANPKFRGAHEYARYMLMNFIRIGVYSGLRPHELCGLKWKDVVHYQHKGEEHVRFNIPPDTKTGARSAVCQPQVIGFLKELRAISNYTNPDDFILTSPKGDQYRVPNAPMRKMLARMGMRTDIMGNAFTPNSVRHTYITFRLQYGGVDVLDLARNCGNSPEIIRKHYDKVVNAQITHRLTQVNSNREDAEPEFVNVEAHDNVLHVDIPKTGTF